MMTLQGSISSLRSINSTTPWLDEHDACAIVAAVKKDGEATHGNLKRTMNSLSKMGHRSGDVDGEGDGCGVLTDIPRRIWSEALEDAGKPAWLAEDKRFFVGHFMIPGHLRGQKLEYQALVLKMAAEAGADILLHGPGQTRSFSLGRLAKEQEPLFWQIAGLMGRGPLESVERRLFELTLKIEQTIPIHIASLSSHSVVYKVRGSIETLYHYYPELRLPDYTSTITLGHARYSTNTTTSFERVQPFSLLGHNGEINTIARLREQAQMLGVQLPVNGSDSQDLDRIIATFIHYYGFSLMEAMELIFPPIISEVEKLPQELQAIYHYYRQAFGPFAQGPAAIIARYGDECVFSVDALGLRPLWFGETDKEYFFSSEKGVYPLDGLLSDPHPLSPGEKMNLRLRRAHGVGVLDYPTAQQRLLKQTRRRFGSIEHLGQAAFKPTNASTNARATTSNEETASYTKPELNRFLAAYGWSRDDQSWVETLAKTGHEPIGSLGYDYPLAALSTERQNIADYFKEAVAVVTNPAIDREREQEHFSTMCAIGPRSDLMLHGRAQEKRWALDCPILLGGATKSPVLPHQLLCSTASRLGSVCIDDLMAYFGDEAVFQIETVTHLDESIDKALERLAKTAIQAVLSGAKLIVLDDTTAFTEGQGWVDPHLAVASVDHALRTSCVPTRVSIPSQSEEAEQPVISMSLRRRAGLVLVSGALRNLHDFILALGLGADAVAPYMLLEVATGDPMRQLEPSERMTRITNTVRNLRVGLEKIISTMGIHELHGYGRLFSSIGLSQPIASVLGTTSYAGSEQRGLTWDDLDADAAARAAIIAEETPARPSRINHLYSKVWKIARQVAQAETEDQQVFEKRTATLVQTQPIALRHVLDFRYSEENGISPQQVGAGLTGHDLPFVIASMSFGSQSETAFRAYAEAAHRLNIIALNGEGGEIADLMGKYPHNRGQQIASGRFGVDIDLINSSNLLEIKVGQGAKPGEGGHLPGRKVSEKIAKVRHTKPGTDLISPSNNHDIYSIEDLAQFIEELRTANPKARVAVKVPVVPGIDVISVGIAKAGADIVNLTGYDGGTGAARQHAIRHAGLPAEIGVVLAHRALTQAGLRDKMELWCDGGMRTAVDVVKMICLGANRIGFGTLAMVALGCTICRSCQKGNCHVGISTQIETKEEAQIRGLHRFEPLDFERGVQGIVNLFSAMSDEVRAITARLGFERTQDLVGRVELLDQVSHHKQLDLSDLLTPVSECVQQAASVSESLSQGQRSLRRPRNHLTTVISNLVMEAAVAGENIISFEDDKVTPVDRALGTHLSGAFTRYRRHWMWPPGHNGVGGSSESWRPPVNGSNGNGEHVEEASLRFYASSVPGNGLGAYTANPINIIVEGGAQDGVAKGMSGGRLIILKGYNHNGIRVDGSVGKGLAYGATGGLVVIQGDADSRACIRLSGADVIIGGEIKQPVNDSLGFIGARANVKGFLCEYMTAGRVLVLGDPGPWICAGMTGGVLYLHLQPHLNFNKEAIYRRIARGAKVVLRDVDDSDERNLQELITAYAKELSRGHQKKEARRALELLWDWRDEFVKVMP